VIAVPGIGHRIKSRNNPDLRVELVKDYVKANFPNTKLLDYALAVETVTTSKKDNLILNVDGCIAVCFVDLLRNCGAFSPEEAEDYLGMGVLNGLFVLGRSIGLIAHFLDQKRLRTGLYRFVQSLTLNIKQVKLTFFDRHPWDDITHVQYLLLFMNGVANWFLVIYSQPCKVAAKVVSKLLSRR
jgi:ATP citrate (pro-S)-lyase